MSSAVEQEPAWLVAKVDQRIAMFKQAVDPSMLEGFEAILTPLSEPETAEDQRRWDLSCDNCGAFKPLSIVTGHVERKVFDRLLLITFGACRRCWGAA